MRKIFPFNKHLRSLHI